jgi:hypothetical protein
MLSAFFSLSQQGCRSISQFPHACQMPHQIIFFDLTTIIIFNYNTNNTVFLIVNLICRNPNGTACSSSKATQYCNAGRETEELVLQSGL